MGVILLACMSVYQMHAWCPEKADEGSEPSGTGIADSCEPPDVGKQTWVLWKRNQCPSRLRHFSSSLLFLYIPPRGITFRKRESLFFGIADKSFFFSLTKHNHTSLLGTMGLVLKSFPKLVRNEKGRVSLPNENNFLKE